MWFDEAVFYQFYPLGFCGCKEWNDYAYPASMDSETNITKTISWINHLERLGITAVYFSPVFQSDKHGYDTRDYYTIDYRLGSNEDFVKVCTALHEKGIRVILDAVFNHVGRGFWAFQDVCRNKGNSQYKDWFYIDWNKNSYNNDGFWYEGWEGHYDLVKLNLNNSNVKDHLFGAIQKWIDLFHIDGLRLDVAYCLNENFLKDLRNFCNDKSDYFTNSKGSFFLLGEVIHSNDMKIVNPQMVNSCTNYEVYKGLHSSITNKNMFEISYSLNRLFGKSGIEENKKLLSFVDNHDVERIASLLNKQYIKIIYGMLFTIPGIPCIYYGSEFACEGKKSSGDNALRPKLNNPEWNDLTDYIEKLIKIYLSNEALKFGHYENILIKNQQLIFKRSFRNSNTGKETNVYVLINLDEKNFVVNSFNSSKYINLYTKEIMNIENSITLAGNSIQIIEQV